ncbi:MAG: hypothetical protein IBX71_01070, partial [Candidatus Desulforudis sp.]|nr:hypothetical protein [Desulforudis sp.]
MNKITFPLKRRMKSPEVGDLQDALKLLLDRGVLLAHDEAARRKLSEALRRERAEQAYGEATSMLVGVFQKERGLQAGGEVDELTADALNTLLREFGVLDERPAHTDAAFLDTYYTVVCRAVDARGKPIVGLRIEAFDQDPKSPDDPLGEPADTDEDGLAVIRFKRSDFTEHPGEGGPDLYFKVYRGETLLHYVLQEIRNDKGVIQNFQPQREPIVLRVNNHQVVAGVIVLDHGLLAENLKLRLYRRDFGGKSTLLAETSTLAGGRYVFTYDPGDKALSLEVRAVDNANKEILLSKPLNDLSTELRAVVNLVAPGNLQPLAAEYRRLSADLTPHVGQLTKLAEARENVERQDLTVLNRATGWDARLIALAAVTERLSADPEVKLPQEAVYGLLRAGLPSDKLLLAQVNPEVAEQALKTVRNAGIVALSDPEIGRFKKQFETFAEAVRLNIPAPGSRSTYGALLKASGLSQEAQDKFVPIYLNHRGDAARLWDEAYKAGLNEAQIGRLQLQGKLAFLAGNSEAMTARLLRKRINDPVQLVEQDFHRAEAWAAEVFDQAGIPPNRRNNLTDADRKKLDELIPVAYAAEKVEDRLHAYTGDMARKVRLSYPTQVLARLFEKDDRFKPLAHPETVTLLKSAAGQGFRLGETPVAAFLKTHTGVAASKAARQQLQTLQRVYQITPGNEAIPVLMSLGMTSAYDVMAYPEAAFVELFNAKYLEIHKAAAASGLAGLVYRKAKQVSSVTYNLFTIAKKLDSEPPVAGLSAPVEVRESVRNELIKQFPTMESLFGSMDFCECEHCRSVLSPAAYLVDLLQFVDPEPGVWGNFLAHWKATHNNQDYPHKKANGDAMKPYDVLIERRPDLPRIPLTCENTHTALPYIDVVNEILEYYVAHGKLEEKAAHDTGEATTAELLAEPQNVIRQTYDKLREARYPLNLPFDLWIETVRRFCNYFETPLAQVLEVFRQSDDLFVTAQPYDRAGIFIESLGLSPTEASIFTDADPLAGGKWYELYGCPTVRPAVQNPTNVDHATLTIPDADAGKFQAGLICTYFDVSANALSAERKTIKEVGAQGSGGPGRTRITLWGVWDAPPVAGDLLVCDASAALKSAKALSRRLGVRYKELVEIVKTGFVNPKLEKLNLLYKLGVNAQDARFYLDHKHLTAQDPATLGTDDQKRRLEVIAFADELQRLADAHGVSAADLEAEVQAIPFGDVLVLADPDAGCDFDQTTLRYADGEAAGTIVFLCINLFVRLWRKLGWSIEETDRALTTFIPQSAPFDGAHTNLAEQPLKTALIYLSHLKALDEKIKVGKQSRLKLLTLWSNMATTGKKPLYAQLFLTRSVLKSAPVFDHP